MNLEIVEEPIQFQLHGVVGVVENERYAEVGLCLMNEMWRLVKRAKMRTTGINHWVYLPDKTMFVGIELSSPQDLPTLDLLEPIAFELPRYLKHVHVGPYEALPQRWKELTADLTARGEVIGSPSLEIYGHQCDGPSSPETTILIGLQAKTA